MTHPPVDATPTPTTVAAPLTDPGNPHVAASPPGNVSWLAKTLPSSIGDLTVITVRTDDVTLTLKMAPADAERMAGDIARTARTPASRLLLPSSVGLPGL